MNSENGSRQFRVQLSPKFERSAKVLKKSFKSQRQVEQFVDCVGGLIAVLVEQPRHPSSRLEPIPGGMQVPEGWEFRKVMFKVPGTSGAAGEGRLIYVVNYGEWLIQLLWLYTHEEFKGRPPDKDLKQLLQEALEQEE